MTVMPRKDRNGLAEIALVRAMPGSNLGKGPQDPTRLLPLLPQPGMPPWIGQPWSASQGLAPPQRARAQGRGSKGGAGCFETFRAQMALVNTGSNNLTETTHLAVPEECVERR